MDGKAFLDNCASGIDWGRDGDEVFLFNSPIDTDRVVGLHYDDFQFETGS